MSKDRQNMQHRYVELFYTPPAIGHRGSGGGGGGGGGGVPSAYAGYDGQY